MREVTYYKGEIKKSEAKLGKSVTVILLLLVILLVALNITAPLYWFKPEQTDVAFGSTTIDGSTWTLTKNEEGNH